MLFAMVAPLLSVVGAFLVGTVIIGLLARPRYAAINGALGDVRHWLILCKATPAIFGGLAVMIASAECSISVLRPDVCRSNGNRVGDLL